MENKKPHFGRVFVVSFLLYILYFGIIDTIDTSIDNKLFFLLISPAFLVLGILTYYAFYYDIAKYMLFFFIIIAMLYLSYNTYFSGRGSHLFFFLLQIRKSEENS